MPANDPNARQVGGSHYQHGGEQHWDRQYRLYGPGYFVGCATKYVERYKDKNGKQDLEKAIHFIEKLISLEYPNSSPLVGADEPRGFNPEHAPLASFPKPTYANVKPTGWVNFSFEGATKDWSLFTCRYCKKEVRTAPENCPDDYHDVTDCKPF